MYEKLHNKFKSTYSRGIWKEKKCFCSESLGATAGAAAAHRIGKETRANKCLLCKQIIFKLSHQKFPLHWLLSTFFSSFSLRFSLWCTPQSLPPRHSKAEVKKCTLTISIYAKHIIAMYMSTIFRNLSSKLRH